MIECGDQPRESHLIVRQRKSLPESTLSRGLSTGFVTTVESQLAVRGQAVTLGSTPKATLLEPCLFRKFVASRLLPESYGEGVASGVWVRD